MTLDSDDVALARQWLGDRSRWSDDETVRQYEREFAAWNGSRHAYAFLGGRVALSACLEALALSPGDEVILPAYTCVVVVNALRFLGLKPVYADIELETFGLDAGAVEARITGKTRAVILHHLYGLVSRDYRAILELARARGLRVIEDCAHSAGAAYAGAKVGTQGDLAFYSSERSKIFNTIVGGLAVTNDDEIARRLERLSAQAPRPDPRLTEQALRNVVLDYFQFKHAYRWAVGDLAELVLDTERLVTTSREEERGVKPSSYGARMPAPLAVIGLNQLRKIDAYNHARRRQAAKWREWCDVRGLTTARVIEGSIPVFLRFPVLVDPAVKRDPQALREELGVEIGVWFVSHLHPAKDDLVGFPQADTAIARCINLPSLLH